MRVAAREMPFQAAVSVTVTGDATAEVDTANDALVAPAATVTLAGTDAAALPLVSVTGAPPLGAGALSVTVPVAPAPPTRLVGETASADRAGATGVGGLTVSVALRETPPDEAVTTASVWLVTAVVAAVNVRLVEPAATVTLAGTVAAAELSERLTTVPPEGAAALSVTVPVEELPPATVDGERPYKLLSGKLVLPFVPSKCI